MSFQRYFVAKKINVFSRYPFLENVFKNSFWNVAALVLQRGTIFLVGIIIARLLGTELYGKYTLIKTTIQVFELSLGIAFGLSMTKFVSENKTKRNSNILRIVKSNFISSALLSILLFIVLEIFAEDFASKVLQNKELLNLFKIAVFYVLLSNITHCLLGLFKGEEEFKLLFKINLLTSILNLGTVTILTYFFSIQGAIIALVLFGLFQLIIHLYMVKKKTTYIENIFSKPIPFDFEIMKKFNLPAIISGLAAPPALWYINLKLSQTYNGFYELALFNASYLIFTIIVFLPVSISDAIFPLFNKAVHDQKKFKKIVIRSLLLILIIAILVSLCFNLFATNLLALFGKDFTAGVTALRYLSIAAVFSSLLTVLGRLFATINKMWLNLTFNFLWAISVVSCSIFFLNQGAVGIAKAFLISYFILFTIQFLYSYHYLKKQN